MRPFKDHLAEEAQRRRPLRRLPAPTPAPTPVEDDPTWGFTPTTVTALRNTQSRSLVTATKPKLGGGHDEHRVFHPPFNKAVVGTIVFGVTFLGIAIPIGSAVYQNKKHGFTK
ncbi:Hypothetical Protein FCC1311_078412 [Hondaea fermentalgiana]|uniref:Uncharacterized protein n=1 Tax=Hondaea fermentalgiana TaxID=2315210 RepID=A0A2R5GL38_9STRA|nr:Hypothetical Protein FCC1311_078412 [Hondaea fermentalgiana]|eukprot:GBG31616.1 Hypothetical Protein FCC1311_078412 [Hondaea fermentalgiana]